MQNIKITVATTESAIDDDDSVCVYRDGAPADGENRPEIFTCTSSMIGRYVKVSMVDVDPAQLLCLAELEPMSSMWAVLTKTRAKSRVN
ncbi:hypothetical protein EB796_022384 [Bugula neritina]|uniref:Uncharacterized protein n=1 Tax=Bugula neritina TaxID=10212 RepID=A0A7J7IZS1_BUGNE|nr:hypothetical protein EB796_022384 [Bugula neritina]